MRILAVHSSTPHLGVAVTENGRTLAEIILPPGREHLENLAPTIEELRRLSNFHFRDLDGLGVAVGPGSFSGIRVGLATIKGMALALNIPVAGIPSLEVLAWDALHDGELGAPVIDAKRGEIYTGIYRKQRHDLIAIEGPMLLRIDRFAVLLDSFGGSVRICGDHVADVGPGPLVNPAGGRGVPPSPSTCARLAESRIRSGRADNIHALAPLYIRHSDAEEKKCRVDGKKGPKPSNS